MTHRRDDGIDLGEMLASHAIVIDERILPLLRRCLREHDPDTLLHDLARCAYVQGLTDGVQLVRQQGETDVKKA